MPSLPQGIKWIATLNNPTEEEKRLWSPQRLLQDGKITYGVLGREIAPSTGTPHLQCFFVFCSNQRLHAVRRLLGLRGHYELARGTALQNRTYCIKDGDFDEAGEAPPNEQGRRTDVEAFVQWLDEFEEREGRCAESPDIAREQPNAYIRYNKASQLASKRAKRSLFPVPEELKDWQDEVLQVFDDEADDRQVHFIVGTSGGEGKTTLCNVIEHKFPDRTQVLSVTKRENLAYMVRESCDIFVFNVARGDMEYLSYKLLEELKDRRVTSGKYNSRMKILRKKPHVIVLSNEYPDMNKLTEDRYSIKEI